MLDLIRHSFIYAKCLLPVKSKQKTIQDELLSSLPEIIDYVKISENNVYIKLKKNLILETENIVHKADNLNIQLGKMIHLNPKLNNNFIKEVENSSLTNDVKQLVKDINDKTTK